MTKIHLVSKNLKTGYSINFPIEHTCHPTSICKYLCYGKKGRLRMPNSLARQQKIYDLFLQSDVADLGKAIGDGYRKKNLEFLRWCGVGDLFREAVDVLNYLGKNYSDTVHWIVTRKPEMVKRLGDYLNFFIMFSLDNSTDSILRKKEVDLLQHPRLYYSYLKTANDEDITQMQIVFHAQQLKHKLASIDKKKECPVDSGLLSISNACQKCKKCFSERIFT